MTILEAATQVLREEGKSLHVDEITKHILSRGLWKTSGRTPNKTVGATLYKGHSFFSLTAPSTFGLKEWESSSGCATSVQLELVPAKTYSFIESAWKVLKEFGEKSPMHY